MKLAIAASNLAADTSAKEAEKKVKTSGRPKESSLPVLKRYVILAVPLMLGNLTSYSYMMLRYKKVSNTNQYNSKATRLAAYNAHKDDESEMEDLDPPHDH